jgi:hypothetical protein
MLPTSGIRCPPPATYSPPRALRSRPTVPRYLSSDDSGLHTLATDLDATYLTWPDARVAFLDSGNQLTVVVDAALLEDVCPAAAGQHLRGAVNGSTMDLTHCG